jgi:3-methyl-2-oxobutanoate hydroxymethyltransferase
MPRIFNWAAQPCNRRSTVASLKDSKGIHGAFAQVTAETEVEARAAEEAGIELLICRAANVRAVRAGAPTNFITAALGFANAITDEEILRTAFAALVDGADAVLTGRRLEIVSLLAAEDIPVVGHLGFVPRKSTWVGQVRPVGKTADEALDLYHKFRRLEDAGAFAVEAELVPARLMAEIGLRSGLVTISLGSGPAAEVAFLFMSDICGETEIVPRHARKYGDIASLNCQIVVERIRALTEFRQDVAKSNFPAMAETAALTSSELDIFLRNIDE